MIEEGPVLEGSILTGLGTFDGLTQEEMQSLEENLRLERHPTGTVLVEQGDLPTKFFVVVAGHATVHRDGAHVADLGPGSFFGEVGVVSLETRNASVIATTPIQVGSVMGWRLREMLEELPGLQAAIEAAIRARETG